MSAPTNRRAFQPPPPASNFRVLSDRTGPRPTRSVGVGLQMLMKPAAMRVAIRSFTASKSSESHRPPASLLIRPVRASVSLLPGGNRASASEREAAEACRLLQRLTGI